ncbi:UDP glucuronosyltransferase 5 family, polypeptide F1 isoform X2 [Triplophysa rosa]|uniref:UDP-glucuronosyltransferase n=2 Tax=Triplophysa rosa TaxID=992332 RepID=A0A9W7TUR1_TRIRA|nr:UDP glucuronosyltransferase 5 family, polypeptide F1 isoform X2 [Triplophysa rosa]XP_057204327.1 UDP glucuronosyltransferase 5 family, polypeptide F1 isoform X2 [Triplophysa rosa]KAI7802612.1 UDP glucuronosyltransferase 5 family [Triplophysa rosa]
MDFLFFVLNFVLTLTLPVHCGKILVFPHEGSHWINMNVLIEELHARGHHITVLRALDSWYIAEESPHYVSITLPVLLGGDDEFYHTFISKQLQIRRQGHSAWTRFKLDMSLKDKFSEMHQKICELVIYIIEKDPALIDRLEKTGYDVMLTDPANGGGVVLAHYLHLPLVLNVRWTVHGEAHFGMAPSPLSYVPFPLSQLTDRMTFIQRTYNLLFYTVRLYLYKRIVGPHYRALCARYFHPHLDYFELFQAADIWLMRVDFVFEFPRPTMPNIIYVGGFQCKPAKRLPADLEDFVQTSGDHGVIVMSLGTLVGQLPLDIAEEIAAAFAELPQKVILRYTGERPSALANNTLLVKWFPQNDLLGHPKTRLFVSHGGTNGIFEAIYHGVPIVGLPLVFDQDDNLSKMRSRGVAKVVDIATIDRRSFKEALHEVLRDPSYRRRMQKLSQLHRDTPLKPLESAIFWTEFVMRHKGAAHLRTEAYKMPWYSYYSVDVVGFLMCVVLLTVFVVFNIIRCLCCRCVKRKKKQD